MKDCISLVIAPLFVGLVITLVSHWLDDQQITEL
ncbi:type I toxin-antitoxin system Fst family toxin [Tetragenococcus halophilus]|nr:type I toxin-antitoxin system Fst family toxin [Tetragenococcus halophilus]MCF1675273.1 type I toxin-antitoxin system Fst family toxin [Tetragenococcus halophilus]